MDIQKQTENHSNKNSIKMSNKKKYSKLDNAMTKQVNTEETVLFGASVRNGKIYIQGDSRLVNFFLDADNDSTRVGHLMHKLCELNNSSEKPKYTGEFVSWIPPLPVKFKSEHWNWKVAREQLTIYLSIDGFGPNGDKRYMIPSDKPEFWPPGISWTNFPYPGKCSFDDCNTIIEAMLSHFQIDVRN